jgi:hypothetical protein
MNKREKNKQETKRKEQNRTEQKERRKTQNKLDLIEHSVSVDTAEKIS